MPYIAEFEDWLASFPPLFYVRVPSDTWHSLARSDKDKLIAHNKEVEDHLEVHMNDASFNDAFVTFALDIWKSFPVRLRQKVTAWNTELVNEMCDSKDVLTIPADVWRVLSQETRRSVVGHNRAILDEARQMKKTFSH